MISELGLNKKYGISRQRLERARFLGRIKPIETKGRGYGKRYQYDEDEVVKVLELSLEKDKKKVVKPEYLINENDCWVQ